MKMWFEEGSCLNGRRVRCRSLLGIFERSESSLGMARQELKG